jgi:hypothetical protein
MTMLAGTTTVGGVASFTQLWIAIARLSSSIPGLAIRNMVQLTCVAMVFGLLFFRSRESYIYSSVVFTLVGVMPASSVHCIAGRFLLDAAIFRKDADVGAMEPIVFCIANAVVYIACLAVPAVLAHTLLLSLVMTDLLTFDRLISLLGVTVTEMVSAIFVTLAIGGLGFYRGWSEQKVTLYSATTVALTETFSGFFVAPKDVSAGFLGVYAISWTRYSYGAGLRILLTGLVLTDCRGHELIADYMLCDQFSPDGLLRTYGYDDVDVGQHLGIIVAMWAAVFALFVIFMKFGK